MENERLNVVKQFLQLPINNQVDLQDIIYLAAEICQTPIASITLVDDKKQYPIIGKGAVIESSCEIAFCSHTIKQEAILEISDALQNPDFLNNPLVTNHPNIRFYAGAPLKTTSGYTIGSLCVIDHQPKKLSESQIKSLEILAKQTMHRLELYLNTQMIKDSVIEVEQNIALLEQAEIMQSSFYNNCNDCFLLLNNNFEVVSFNASAQKLFSQYNNMPLLKNGELIFDFLPPSNVSTATTILKRVKEGETVQTEVLANPGSENSFWNRFSISPATNARNEVIGIACIGTDIDNEKKQEKKIKTQQLTLTQIAQVHSHEIRHPLTNILGMINLIRQEDFSMNKLYIDCLEKASIELDSVIRKVVSNSRDAA